MKISTNYYVSRLTTLDLVLRQWIQSKKILKGRPFGGTAILVNSKWGASVSEILLTERMTVMRFCNILIFNVYLPYDSSTSVSDFLMLPC